MRLPSSFLASPARRVLKNPTRLLGILRLLLTWYRIYFGAQRSADVAQARVVETSWDKKIKIKENGIYTYLFACMYAFYIAWYLIDKLSHSDFRKAYLAFDSMFNEAGKIFRAHPTRMKNRARVTHPLTIFTHQFDGPTNCYPSLHVAIVTLSYNILKRIAQDDDPRAYSAMRQSCIDICRSTMEVKQHSVIDVMGGYGLAAIVFRAHFKQDFDRNILDDILPEFANSKEFDMIESLAKPEDLIPLLNTLLSRSSQKP